MDSWKRVSSITSTTATLAGQTIGAFEVVSQIGQGGMGSVWLARRNDGRFERQVALKFLNIALLGKEGEDRFKREGKILALLAHPHIAELIDAGCHHRRPTLSCARICRRRPDRPLLRSAPA